MEFLILPLYGVLDFTNLKIGVFDSPPFKQVDGMESLVPPLYLVIPPIKQFGIIDSPNLK